MSEKKQEIKNMGEWYFNKGLSAYSSGDDEAALNNFMGARRHGYKLASVYCAKILQGEVIGHLKDDNGDLFNQKGPGQLNSQELFSATLCCEFEEESAVLFLRNKRDGFNYAIQATLKGNVLAESHLGEHYLKQGKHEQALYWYGRAARKGNPVAIKQVMQIKKILNTKFQKWASVPKEKTPVVIKNQYEESNNVVLIESDAYGEGIVAYYLAQFPRAKECFKKAADAGNFLASLYYAAILIEENNFEDAKPYLRALQFHRGWFFEKSPETNKRAFLSGFYTEIVDGDMVQAITLYEKSGYQEAQLRSGRYYLKQKDYSEAGKFFELFSTSDSDTAYSFARTADGNFHLSECLRLSGGLQVYKDDLLIKAADKGHALAQYRLGLFNRSIGSADSAENLGFAIAEGGNLDAYYELGLLYWFGVGMNKNQLEAMNIFNMAAAQGHQDSQKALTTFKLDSKLSASSSTTTITVSSFVSSVSSSEDEPREPGENKQAPLSIKVQEKPPVTTENVSSSVSAQSYDFLRAEHKKSMQRADEALVKSDEALAKSEKVLAEFKKNSADPEVKLTPPKPYSSGFLPGSSVASELVKQGPQAAVRFFGSSSSSSSLSVQPQPKKGSDQSSSVISSSGSLNGQSSQQQVLNSSSQGSASKKKKNKKGNGKK